MDNNWKPHCVSKRACAVYKHTCIIAFTQKTLCSTNFRWQYRIARINGLHLLIECCLYYLWSQIHGFVQNDPYPGDRRIVVSVLQLCAMLHCTDEAQVQCTYLHVYTLRIQKCPLVLHECTVPKCLSLHWSWTSGEHGSLTLCALSPTEANCQEVQEEAEHPRGCQGGGNRWWENRRTFTDLFKWLLQAHTCTCTWNPWKRLVCMCKGRFLCACTYLPGQSTWKGLYWVCTILLHVCMVCPFQQRGGTHNEVVLSYLCRSMYVYVLGFEKRAHFAQNYNFRYGHK